MSENSEKTGARGRPFPKGKSGNPGGRPKCPEDVKALIQKNTVKAIRKVISLLDSENDKVALAAAIAILDRALGKPETTSKVELSGRGDVKEYVCRWMTEDDVKKANAA